MSARLHAAIAALRDLHEAQQLVCDSVFLAARREDPSLEVAIGEAFSRLRGSHA